METSEMRTHATYMVHKADETLKEGKVEDATAMYLEAKNEFAAAEAREEVEANLAELKGEMNKPMNTVPIASTDIALHNLDEGGAELRASYKPADWVKGLPAASQPMWVQEKMGVREKEEAVFYKDVFTKYIQSSNDAAFRLSLTPQETKAMEEGTDSLLCPLS